MLTPLSIPSRPRNGCDVTLLAPLDTIFDKAAEDNATLARMQGKRRSARPLILLTTTNLGPSHPLCLGPHPGPPPHRRQHTSDMGNGCGIGSICTRARHAYRVGADGQLDRWTCRGSLPSVRDRRQRTARHRCRACAVRPCDCVHTRWRSGDTEMPTLFTCVDNIILVTGQDGGLLLCTAAVVARKRRISFGIDLR